MPDPDDLRGPAVALPAGAKDVLPVEAEELREIERRLIAVIATFGYREVMTPIVELAEVLDHAQEGGLERTLRLFDEGGRVLVLRPDLTIPVARLIATRYPHVEGPIRLSYSARRFRRPQPGRPSALDQWQVGVELAGDGGPSADAEIVALLGRALAAAGLVDSWISVADLAITDAVLGDFGVEAARRAELAAAAADRNLVAWRHRVARLGLDPAREEFLASLPDLRGDAQVLDRIEQIAPGARAACDRLRRTLALVRGDGAGERVVIDFAISRDWAYYTGLIVEAHASGVGAPVAAGGRYDALGARFGADRASAGFSIDLDLVHRALRASGANGDPARSGVALVDDTGALAGAAAQARAAGMRVVRVCDLGAGEAVAARDGLRYLARADGEGIAMRDLESGDERRVGSLSDVTGGS